MGVELNLSSPPTLSYADTNVDATDAAQTADGTSAVTANNVVAFQSNVWTSGVNPGQGSTWEPTAPDLGAPDPSASDPKRATTSFSAALDDLLVLLTDLVKTNLVMGHLDQESRELEMNAQVDAINKSADKMVEAASDQLVGAAVGFAVTCAVSAVSLGMSVKSANLTTEAGEATEAATNAETKIAQTGLDAAEQKSLVKASNASPELKQDAIEDIDLQQQKDTVGARADQAASQMKAAKLNASATKWGTASQVVGQMGASAGNVVTAGFGVMAANAEKDGKKDDGQAAQHDFQKSKLTDQVNATHDMVQKVLDTMKTLIELNNATVEKVNQPV
jgi:hypothetical protein